MHQYALGAVLPNSSLLQRLQASGALVKIATQMQPAATGINTLVPGASALPASVGSKLTWKNVGIAGIVATLGYFAYEFLLLPPPKKPVPRASTVPAPAPSPVAAMAGLFGVKYRRRRR